ncbi:MULTISPECIES: efflux RND transporter periplasmic adaptor subunit [unclassified Desulfovibrio]|uniref:efflux RND transporter periplasmic adaptor subunit n=1 Tax=unclassified Desulfovibrio TaxID=2593640 RepID=UPI002FD93BE2
MTSRQLFSLPLALALCLVLVACDSEKKAQQGPMRLPVAVFDVVARDEPWPAEYQAQASGSRAVEVRARVEAIIEKRLYEEGDYVEQGQLLFQLERDHYEALMQQAQAQFTNAEREWRRVRPLYEKNAVSQKERDNALAAYESAKASLRQAKINLDYCQVTAPVSGYSSKENYTPGNLVGNNSLLTYVNQTDPMYIDFSIAAPERMTRQSLAAEGRLVLPADGHYKARLRLLDGTMYKGEGEVTFIDSQVQPSTGVIKARAVFANADRSIMPGQYVRLYMDGDILKNAVLVPQKCVLLTQKGSLVMGVDKDDKVYPIPVVVGVSVGDKYLVLEGLKGGERIISEGIIKARPGTQVSIMPSGGEQPREGAAKK